MKRKFLIAFLYLFALAFSFFKTARLPNEWSEAHWMLDYRFGFIKRGLAGEIFGFFFVKSEVSIIILSAGILLLLYIVLMSAAVKYTLRNCSIYRILFYLIFFLSQYIVFSAHLIGYLDHLIFLLTFAAVYLIRNKKVLLSSLLLSLCIFIHEISFFIVLPICLFTLAVTEMPERELYLNRGLMKKAVLFLLLPCAVTASIMIYQERHAPDQYPLLLSYLENTGFISKKVAHRVAVAYTNSFNDYFASESAHFFQRVFVSRCTIKYGIPMLFMMYMIYKEFRGISWILLAFLAAVAGFPLLLHSIAWDTFRIWTFPFMMLFLGFWVLHSKFRAGNVFPNKLSLYEFIFFAVSLMLVTVLKNDLFDDETERFSGILRIAFFIAIFFIAFYLNKQKDRISKNN